jgi:hypothetical protein
MPSRLNLRCCAVSALTLTTDLHNRFTALSRPFQSAKPYVLICMGKS